MIPARDPAPAPNNPSVTAPVPQQPLAISPAAKPLIARGFVETSGGALYTAFLSVISAMCIPFLLKLSAFVNEAATMAIQLVDALPATIHVRIIRGRSRATETMLRHETRGTIVEYLVDANNHQYQSRQEIEEQDCPIDDYCV